MENVFYVEWWLNYGEIRSAGRFMVVLGTRKHFLLVTNDFERNDLISPEGKKWSGREINFFFFT